MRTHKILSSVLKIIAFIFMFFLDVNWKLETYIFSTDKPIKKSNWNTKFACIKMKINVLIIEISSLCRHDSSKFDIIER